MQRLKRATIMSTSGMAFPDLCHLTRPAETTFLFHRSDRSITMVWLSSVVLVILVPFSRVPSHADLITVGFLFVPFLGTLKPPLRQNEPEDMKEGHIGGNAEPGSRTAAAMIAALFLPIRNSSVSSILVIGTRLELWLRL